MQGGEAQLFPQCYVILVLRSWHLSTVSIWPKAYGSNGPNDRPALRVLAKILTTMGKKTSSCLFECAQFIDRGAPTNYLVQRRMFLLVVWLEIFQAPMQPVPQIPQALHDDGQLSTMHCTFKRSYLVTKFLARPSSCTSCHVYKSVCMCVT